MPLANSIRPRRAVYRAEGPRLRGEQGNKLSVFFDRLALILPSRLPRKDPSAPPEPAKKGFVICGRTHAVSVAFRPGN